jgi:hypothetical protein
LSNGYFTLQIVDHYVGNYGMGLIASGKTRSEPGNESRVLDGEGRKGITGGN